MEADAMDDGVEYVYRIAGPDGESGDTWGGAWFTTVEEARENRDILLAEWGEGQVRVERRPFGEWERVS